MADAGGGGGWGGRRLCLCEGYRRILRPESAGLRQRTTSWCGMRSFSGECALWGRRPAPGLPGGGGGAGRPLAKAQRGEASVWGLPGPSQVPGACASIRRLPAARGTVWGSRAREGGRGSGGRWPRGAPRAALCSGFPTWAAARGARGRWPAARERLPLWGGGWHRGAPEAQADRNFFSPLFCRPEGTPFEDGKMTLFPHLCKHLEGQRVPSRPQAPPPSSTCSLSQPLPAEGPPWGQGAGGRGWTTELHPSLSNWCSGLEMAPPPLLQMTDWNPPSQWLTAETPGAGAVCRGLVACWLRFWNPLHTPARSLPSATA